jgi:hypothetical protein
MININSEFTSQMGFLKTYAEQSLRKQLLIDELKKKAESLKGTVDQFESINEEIEDLQKSLRLDEKFLISMNEMVLRNTGDPISNGPLFEEKKTETEQEAA